MFTVDQL